MMQVSPQSDGGVCAAGQQTGAGPPQERGAGPGDWVEERGGPEHHRAPPPHLPADKPAELEEARSLRVSKSCIYNQCKHLQTKFCSTSNCISYLIAHSNSSMLYVSLFKLVYPV